MDHIILPVFNYFAHNPQIFETGCWPIIFCIMRYVFRKQLGVRGICEGRSKKGKMAAITVLSKPYSLF